MDKEQDLALDQLIQVVVEGLQVTMEEVQGTVPIVILDMLCITTVVNANKR